MSGKSLLDETKILLSALLVSSPNELTIDQLDRDYRDREGRNIPFQLLGHRSLKSLLLSMSDILTYDSYSRIVKAVVTRDSNNAHIHKLVTNQKPSKNKSERNNSKRSNHSRQPNPTHIWDNPPSSYNQHSSFNVNPQYPQNQRQPQGFHPGNLLAPPNLYQPNLIYANRPSLLGMPIMFPNLDDSAARRAWSRCSSNGQSRQNNKSKNEAIKKKSVQNDSPVVSVERKGKTTLNNNADKMEESHSDSKSEEVGALPPIDDFCECFIHCLKWMPPKIRFNDWKVKKFTEAIQDDPIMLIGTLSMSKYGSSIPPAKLPKTLKAGDIYQISVTEITALPHFYFQFHDDTVRGLQDGLTLHCENGFADKIQRSQIRVGNVCAAYFANEWLRAEILTLPDENDRLKTLFVDYGTIDYVSIEFLRCLTTELCEVPRLCHRGSLAFLKPVNNYETERKIIKVFCELVTYKSVIAVFSNVDENKSISMTLIDTESPQDVIVNKVLMEIATETG